MSFRKKNSNLNSSHRNFLVEANLLSLYFIQFYTFFIACLCLYIDYETITLFFQQNINIIYHQDCFFQLYFSENHYEWFQSIAYFIIPFSSFTLVFTYLYRNALKNLIFVFLNWFVKLPSQIYFNFKQSPIVIKTLIFSAILLKIFLLYSLPIFGDEMFDFDFYGGQSFFLSTHQINNHPLNNILTHFLYIIHIPAQLAIRLPSLLASLLLLFSVYHTNRNNRFISQFLVISLISFSFWLTAYGVLGRGFIVVVLFSYWGFWALKTQKWNLFVFANILGLYCNRSFLLVFLSLIVLAFIYKKEALRQIIISILLISVVAFYLYLPFLFFSGGFRTFLFQAQEEFGDHSFSYPIRILETLSFLTEWNSKAYIPFSLFIIAAFYRILIVKKFEKYYSFVLICFLFISIFSIVFQIFLPFRIFLFINFFIALILALEIAHFMETKKTKKIWLIIPLSTKILGFLWIYHFGWQTKYKTFFQSTEHYSDLKNTTYNIIKTNPSSICFEDNSMHLSLSIQYELLKNRKNVNIPKNYCISDIYISKNSIKDTNLILLEHWKFQNTFIYKNKFH